MEKTITPTKISGTVSIPGSKSHTIRALLIATLAEGKSIIKNPLYSLDTLSCIEACKAFGAKIVAEDEKIIVEGLDINQFKQSKDEISIDVGNSGTTLYLATAVAGLRRGKTNFTGDKQIQNRTAETLLASLEDLGVTVIRNNANNAPYTIQGPFKGGKTRMECKTSQFLSGLLIAASLADEKTTIEVPLLNEQPYVTMTLNWLEKQEAEIKAYEGYYNFEIEGGAIFHNFEETICGDFSSATFFFCAPVITRSTLTIENLDRNDSQGDKEVLSILAEMGARIEWKDTSVTVSAQDCTVNGISIDLNTMPDALPALAITAAFSSGRTRIYNVEHARFKETDRIKACAQILKQAGIEITEHRDGLEIIGGTFSSCTIDSLDDHRLAMSAAIAALGAEGPIKILNAEAASVTFPNFYDLIDKISN
ncbi:MAG: 3-phosphoshikimate 1-carboxyvinyltransferase [Spirochaetales bacterium]|nr:3-phosphoshikimate 1-carboxyvinyltransferase [Spirochaetales bacterium]